LLPRIAAGLVCRIIDYIKFVHSFQRENPPRLDRFGPERPSCEPGISGSPDNARSARAGGKLWFAYRVILHEGDASSARIADAFDRFSEPPAIDVTAG